MRCKEYNLAYSSRAYDEFLNLTFVGFCMIEGGQHGWVNTCVMDYPCHPNKCNLDSGDDLPGEVIR